MLVKRDETNRQNDIIIVKHVDNIDTRIRFDRCCYFLPVLLTAGLILTEKKEGIMERMMVSGEYTCINHISIEFSKLQNST